MVDKPGLCWLKRWAAIAATVGRLFCAFGQDAQANLVQDPYSSCLVQRDLASLEMCRTNTLAPAPALAAIA